MKRWMKRFVLLMWAVALQSTLIARAQDGINPRAKEDLKAFMKKVEEGDTLFNQKKYAEAAAALAAAHDLYQRAERREAEIGREWITLNLQPFEALRFYGYDLGLIGGFQDDAKGVVKITAAAFHSAANQMWQDASILSGAAKVPLTGAFSDPPLVEMSDDQLNSIVSTLYGPVSTIKLPVPDEDWHKVVRQSRRAQLIVEYALQKYPEWKSGTRQWSNNNEKLQHTGDEALADIKAKLAEAEPEYQKLVADFKKAEPAGFAAAVREEMDTLNKAIVGVKRNGWLDWVMARDLFITNDYLAERRHRFVAPYTREGKTMPADKLKPVEDKIAELKSAVDQNAPRWRFPAGKPHNATIETRAKDAVKVKFPGATIIKTALDSTDWAIAKNDLGLPRYRSLDVLVLVKISGQKWPWLILGFYAQTYTGGGTFNSGGTFAPPYSAVRLQAAQ